MNAEQLKAYLVEDVERIEKLLEKVGCHRIWRSGDEIRSAPPEGNNHTSVSVNIDTLYCKYYRERETFRGDIFQLIGLFRNEEFKESFRFTRNLFGLSGKFVKEKEKRDPLSVFKGIRKQSRIITSFDDVELTKYGKEALSGFVMLPHMSLFYEGITLQSQEFYNVCYHPQDDRVCFPHYHPLDKEVVVGITGRTLRSKVEMEAFNIPKYFNFIKNYKKSYSLYGFSHAIEEIKRAKMIVIVEGEKSVLKLHSMKQGCAVSVGSHEISPVQVNLILKYTPPDTEVVVAFDTDVMKNEQYLIDCCKKFSRYRKASYIMDNPDFPILGEKDAPVDGGVKKWNHLLKYRKTV